jgi:hypothetical protein
MFYFRDCWPDVSIYPASPATHHLDAGILGFRGFKEILKWFPVSKLLLRASYAPLLV